MLQYRIPSIVFAINGGYAAKTMEHTDKNYELLEVLICGTEARKVP
jgi:hypothetical protein